MPSPIQSASNKVTGSGTTVLTVALTATQAGSCLVAYVHAFGDSASPTTITLTSGTGGTGGTFGADNWAAASSSLSGTGMDAGIWVDPSCATGTNAVKVTTNGTGTQTIMVIVEEWPGLASTFAALVDQVATPLRQSSGGTTWSVGPTGTTSQSNEVIAGCAASFNSSTSSYTLTTPGSPWTEETQVQQTSAGFYQIFAAGYQSVTSSGTFTYAGTDAYKTTACLVTLKATSTAHSGTATLSGSGTLTAAGVFAATAALSGSGTLSGTGRDIHGTILSGSGSLTAFPHGLRQIAIALSGTGTLTGAGFAVVFGTTVLSGSGTLGLQVTLGFPAILSGIGTINLRSTGQAVFASAGAATPQAYPGTSQVAVAPPGSSAWWYLGQIGNVTALKYSFACPGGCDKMSCTVMVPAAYRTQLFNPGWKVRITRGGHQVWSGKLDEPVPSPQGWTLTAVGDGNRGADFTAVYTSTWPASQPDQSVSNAISRGLPWNNPGVGSPAGAWYGQAVDSGAQTIKGLLDLICTRGGLAWYVNSQPGGPPGSDLAVFPLPTAVNRLIVCTQPVARTLGGDIDAIQIRYQVTDASAAGSTATYALTSVKNTASANVHGTIEAYIDLSSAGVMSASAAQAVGNSVLSIYQRASFAGPFTVSYGQLLNAGGQPIDPGTDQAATVARLILTDYGYGGEVTPQFPVTFIVGAYEWDDFAQVATISPYQRLNQSLSGLLSMQNTVLTPITVA